MRVLERGRWGRTKLLASQLQRVPGAGGTSEIAECQNQMAIMYLHREVGVELADFDQETLNSQ